MDSSRHDLKNALNALAIHVALLRQKLRDSPSEIHRQLDGLDADVRLLDRLTTELLDARRSQDGACGGTAEPT